LAKVIKKNDKKNKKSIISQIINAVFCGFTFRPFFNEILRKDHKK